jgi:SAM-dependent methyltransferase
VTLDSNAVADTGLPNPPLELANRVGSLAAAADPFDYYDALGAETRHGIINQLPSDWTFEEKRILDFGCGAGRTLRHFSAEAAQGEFWGCDIDQASIRWMEEQMCPPFHVFINGAEPPLDQPDSSFDLIWAISVFTHLPSSWSRWLIELHRVLKVGGLLLITFMGEGMSEEIAGEPWDESGFGMNVIRCGQSWELGGPMVLHSPWWIEEHWGRAFEILAITPDGFASKPWLDHGTALMRRDNRGVDAEELERISGGDPRETRALAHNVEQLRSEILELRASLRYFDTELEATRRVLEAQMSENGRVRDESNAVRRRTTIAERRAATAREHSLDSAKKVLAVEEVLDELQPRLERAERVMSAMKSSVSWRVTSPLRALKRRR